MSKRPPTIRWWHRPFMPLVSSRFGGWFFVHVAPHIDRWLVRVSRGRLSVALGYPTLILSTVGAKTGQPRATPLIFLPYNGQIVLVASNGGNPRHPGWYYNLRARPEATVTVYGQTGTYRARELGGAEREQAWRAAVALYPGYRTYQQRAGSRLIPIFLLTPT